MDVLAATHYTRPALVPDSGGEPPRRPVLISARSADDGVHLHWVQERRAVSFAAYRFDGTRQVSACELADAGHLVGTARAAGVVQSFTDTTADPGRVYTYVLSTLDHRHAESAPSRPQWTIR